MTDSRALFRSGRRYRGFLQTDRGAVPVTFNVYPLTPDEVRLKHVFPTNVADSLERGSVIYILIENDRPMVGELRILSGGGRFIPARLDYVTEDRRKLPRVKVKGVLDIKADIVCSSGEYRGDVVDLSMTSVGVDVGADIPPQKCDVHLSYGDTRVHLKGRVIRSSDGFVVVEFGDSDAEMTDLLSRVYTDLFLINQREG